MKKETKKAPIIRFRGFTDDWEQRKLAQLFFTATEKNDDGEYSQADILAASLGTELEKKHIFFGLRSTAESVKKYRKVQLGDIVYTKSPIKHYPNGIFRTCKKIPGIVPSMYCVYHKRGNIKINTSIVQCFFENKYRLDNYLRPLVNIGARNNVNITDEEALKGTITIPINIEEQTKIVNLIEKLTILITLHQHKLDQLKKLKKFFLQNMFPAKGEKVPRIRFKGFTGDWEQRKLSDVAERVTRKNKNLESTLPLTISAQYGLIDQNEFFDKRIASKDVSGYYLIRKGEFAYNKSTSNDAPWGAIKRLNRYESGVLSTLYIVFCILDKSKTCSDYLASYYDTNLWHKEVKNIAAEGARNHGLLNIAPADFFETKLMIPKNFEEQQMIGEYFSNLDHLITLHQRKLDQLQTMKKFMLQNMFI